MKYSITTIFVNDKGDFVDFGGWSEKKISEARKYGKKLALRRNEVIRMFRWIGTYNPANRDAEQCVHRKVGDGQVDAQEVGSSTEIENG